MEREYTARRGPGVHCDFIHKLRLTQFTLRGQGNPACAHIAPCG